MSFGTFIKLTNSCSASCSHCPFSSIVEKKYPSLEVITDQVHGIDDPLIILSGGEPLEHPKILHILDMTSKIKDKLFRIATGRHIPLTPIIESIKKSENMTGISLGTDILFPTRNKNNLINNFWSNVSVLNHEQINYSLTFTLGSDTSYQDIKQILLKEIVKPSFILLQYRDDETQNHDLISKISDLIKKKNEKTVIHYANIN
jgi:MoaA/NifB/PqqE/SkfB family radical SAM enzyme